MKTCKIQDLLGQRHQEEPSGEGECEQSQNTVISSSHGNHRHPGPSKPALTLAPRADGPTACVEEELKEDASPGHPVARNGFSHRETKPCSWGPSVGPSSGTKESSVSWHRSTPPLTPKDPNAAVKSRRVSICLLCIYITNYG